jgi:molecular chaperone GrpE
MTEKSNVEERDIERDRTEQEPSEDTKTSESNDTAQREKPSNEPDPLTELQEKYDKLNDKYLRLYSEFENFRRRTAKERLEQINMAGSDVVSEILPVIDDFERAIESNEKNDDHEALKEGFKIIHHKLLHLLKNKGLEPMDSLNKPFDEEYHEAITKIPAPSKDQKGKVIDIAEKGYFFKDKILRYAKVVVGE